MVPAALAFLRHLSTGPGFKARWPRRKRRSRSAWCRAGTARQAHCAAVVHRGALLVVACEVQHGAPRDGSEHRVVRVRWPQGCARQHGWRCGEARCASGTSLSTLLLFPSVPLRCAAAGRHGLRVSLPWLSRPLASGDRSRESSKARRGPRRRCPRQDRSSRRIDRRCLLTSRDWRQLGNIAQRAGGLIALRPEGWRTPRAGATAPGVPAWTAPLPAHRAP